MAADGAWVGTEPDLAAMPVTPADLEAIGLPGFGRFFNGYFNSLDGFVEGTAGFYGRPVEETRAVFDRLGLRRVYGSAMGLPSVPGDDESPPARVAYANIIEFADAAEADAFFDFLQCDGRCRLRTTPVARAAWSSPNPAFLKRQGRTEPACRAGRAAGATEFSRASFADFAATVERSSPPPSVRRRGARDPSCRPAGGPGAPTSAPRSTPQTGKPQSGGRSDRNTGEMSGNVGKYQVFGRVERS